MDWQNTGKRALATGVVAGVATQLMYGSVGSYQMAGMQIPVAAAVGVAAGAGSVVADGGHANMPSMPIMGTLPASATELIVAGVITAGALDFMGINRGFTIEGAALGAGSLLGGRYLNDTLGGT